MFNAVRNVVSHKISRSSRKSGLFGRILKLKFARKLATDLGITGKFAKSSRGYQKTKIGLGALLGIGAVVASVFGARKAIESRNNHK